MSEFSEKLRSDFKNWDDQRDKGLKTPSNVERFNDIVYSNQDSLQVLDVYRPANSSNKKLPVIVSVHGGGWVYGDKERYQYYCMSLVKNGFAVVNYSYRLAPEHKFPAQLEDTNTVFKWVHQNAEKYGFDTAHVFAVGDSAGANLLGMFSCLCTNKEYSSMFNVKYDKKYAPLAIALNCGVYCVEPGKCNEFTTQLVNDTVSNTETDTKQLNLVEYINNDFPSTFFMSCNKDSMLHQVKFLENVLTEKNVSHIYRFYAEKNNDLGHVFHCNVRMKIAQKCNKDECDYFKTFLNQE